MSDPSMLDSHNLKGVEAELRAHLIDRAELLISAMLAEEICNMVNDKLNDMGVTIATSLMARALIAHGIVETASHWWSQSTDPRATPPATTAVMRSFVTDIPPFIYGESYIPGEEGER